MKTKETEIIQKVLLEAPFELSSYNAHRNRQGQNMSHVMLNQVLRYRSLGSCHYLWVGRGVHIQKSLALYH